MEEFRIPVYVASTFFNESAVLLDSRKNVYYALNDSAANLWKFLMETGSYEMTLKGVIELYEYSPDIMKKDLDELVDSLVKSGLLERVKNHDK